jgi:alpha-L-rhamnosidase
MYISRKSADLFKALGMEIQYKFAESLSRSFRQAIRDNLIDFSTMTVKSRCQTAQAICIYYGVFEKGEVLQAAKVLSEICRENKEFINCGMIGLRTIFHVLSDAGEGELAYKMITRPEYPSYGHFVARGFTSLPEDFLDDDRADTPNSLNHHFFGDIISWFIQRVAGIRVNPRNTSCKDFDICPDFIESLNFAEAYYDAPCGRIAVKWKKQSGRADIIIECPDNATGFIRMPSGWSFSDDNTESSLHGSDIAVLKAGKYFADKVR